MPFDSLLLDIRSIKSVAGCESAAMSTEHHSVSSVVQPNSLSHLDKLLSYGMDIRIPWEALLLAWLCSSTAVKQL